MSLYNLSENALKSLQWKSAKTENKQNNLFVAFLEPMVLISGPGLSLSSSVEGTFCREDGAP